jgi:hypothetical protein
VSRGSTAPAEAVHVEGEGTAAETDRRVRQQGGDSSEDESSFLQTPGPRGRVRSRRRAVPIQVVSPRPLIVRAGASLRSEVIGQLLPNQMATVVQELITEDGDVRAQVTFEERPRLRSRRGSLDTTAGAHIVETTVGRGARRFLDRTSGARTQAQERAAAAHASVARTSKGPSDLWTPPSAKVSAGAHAAGEATGGRGTGGGEEKHDHDEDGPVNAPAEDVESETGAPSSNAREVGVAAPGGRDPLTAAAAAAREQGAFQGGGADSSAGRLLTGWATLKKEGVKLVTSRVRIEAWVQQRAVLLWQMQQSNDKLQRSVASEDALADPTGVGFAFGGVLPGTLHAKGTLVDAHKVHYSIARAGRYMLHVRLHKEGRPLPNSPFALTVVPGPAHPAFTMLSTKGQPLRGNVGLGEEEGCSLILRTADRSGNLCTSGGAAVAVSTALGHVQCACEDLENGSYRLSWRSRLTTGGNIETRVTVNGHSVRGSPLLVRLLSMHPDRLRTEAISLGDSRTGGSPQERLLRLEAESEEHARRELAGAHGKTIHEDRGGAIQLLDIFNGVGLKTAVAGRTTSIFLKFRDEHGNPSTPGAGYKVRMAFSAGSEVRKLQDLNEHDDYEGGWGEEDSGRYVITYVARQAGPQSIHLWCEADGEDSARETIPGSPFSLSVTAGEATPSKSHVDGWAVEQMKRAGGGGKGDKGGSGSKGSSPSPASRKSTAMGAENFGIGSRIIAGDSVIVRAYGVDEYANPALAPEGSLSAFAIGPSGGRTPLAVALQAKAGRSATYDVSYETDKSGRHEVHVLLDGEPIRHSPAVFEVVADKATPQNSRLVPPPNADRLVVDFERPSIVELRTHDRFGNPCSSGGLRVSGRLTLVKQGHSDNTILMPNNHSVTVDDRGDGTYAVKVAIMMAATVKLIVNMDKDLPGASGELPVVQIAFANPNEAAAAAPEDLLPLAESPSDDTRAPTPPVWAPPAAATHAATPPTSGGRVVDSDCDAGRAQRFSLDGDVL